MNWKGPFLGFTLNGVHSSVHKIVRINTGDRANLPLSPSFKDTTMEVTGRDGIIYNSTLILLMSFNIDFAFDKILETDIRDLRNWFKPDLITTLVFDENPYKEYTGKISAPVNLSYISFDESNNGISTRVYKGEGNFTFTAHEPWAKAPYWNLTSYSSEQRATTGEWLAASGIAMIASTAESAMTSSSLAYVYNPGDLPSPLSVECTANASNGYLLIQYTDQSNNILRMALALDSNLWGTRLKIDSYTKTITSTVPSTLLVTNANYCLVAGDFINIAPSTTHLSSITNPSALLSALISLSSAAIQPQIYYPYLYR